MTPIHLFRLILILALLVFPLSVASAVGVPVNGFIVPYTSYTYDFWGEATPAPHAYLPSTLIQGADLGVGPLNRPQDLHVSPNGNIYIADTGNHRIITLDSDWNVIRVIQTFERFGSADRFSSPAGVYVTEDESLYVADTGNARIVQFDAEGGFVRVIGPPESEVEGILPANFNYKPLKVGVDQHGRIYVISQDLFEGLISFSQDGQFRGFVGAPRVTPDFFDYLWSRIATREQRARMQAFLPTEYSNLDLNPEGFIYATVIEREDTDATAGSTDMVKLLNAKGEDLLRRIGFHPPVGDVQFPDRWSNATRRSSSTLVDVVAQELDVYSVLDNNRGRVFTYDTNGNLLFVFGYRGDQHGLVKEPAALDYLGKDMLILDSQRGAVVRFEPTEYALLVWAALDAYHRGRYAETEAIWRRVLELNANYDLAYTGIGRSLLRRGEYGEALHYFRLGNNRRDYSEAFSLYRRGVIYGNFSRGVLVVLAAGIALFGTVRYMRRRPTATKSVAAAAEPAMAGDAYIGASRSGVDFDEGPVLTGSAVRDTLAFLRYAFYVIFHPGEGFFQLKKAGKRPLPAAMTILVLVISTYVAARQYTGFIFNTADLTRLNLLMEVASVLVPFALWAGVNWALTTLMDGKGKLVDIVIATAFALLPIVLTHAPMILVSNYITAEEGALYEFVRTLGTLWSGVLIVFGAVMTTHEYDFSKAVWTCVLTVAGMAFVLFLGFLGINLSEQVYLFISEIVSEFLYRT